jgi:hypothetical protein
MEFFIAGHIVEARALLLDLVRSVPTLEAGWMFLCYTLDDPQQKLDCLRQVLSINPDNEEAKIRLEQVQAGLPKSRQPSAEKKADAPEATEPGRKDKVRPASVFPIPSIPVPGKDDPTKPNPPHVSPFTVDISHAGDSLSELHSETGREGKGSIEQPPEAPKEIPPKEIPPKGKAAPPTERKSSAWGWTCGVILFFLVIIAAGLGVWAYSTGNLPAELLGIFPSTAETSMGTDNATVAWTMPAQWTLTATPTRTVTPTETPTPPPESTPTLEPPDPTLLSGLREIEDQVVEMRGLSWNGNLPVYIIDTEKAQGILEGLYEEAGYADTVQNESRVLTALGLIRPGFDLAQYETGTLSASVLGFYLPSEKVIYVIGSPADFLVRLTYSHEFDHALVDSHYPAVGIMEQDPLCQNDSQRCDAIRALVEGDAVIVEAKWYSTFATDAERTAYQSMPTPTVSSAAAYYPPFLTLHAYFPYTYGMQFVDTLLKTGSWNKVNAAYENLPLSTEQIMHPEKYLAGERPITMKDVDLASALGESWTPIWKDSLGEFMTYMVMGYGVDAPSRSTLEELTTLRADALTAAAGWGGDRLLAYYSESRNQTMLAVEWAWDSTSLRESFGEVFLRYLDVRYEGGRIDREDMACWTYGRDTSCFFERNEKALWIIAPDLTTVEQIKAAYGSYP